MRARIQKWGNSLALRLPKSVADRVGVVEGSTVELDAQEHQLVLRPAHRFRLEDLLKKIRPGQLHGETSTGARRGS